MQQLSQKLKNGSITIIDVPVPVLSPGNIMIQNHFSLISAGTDANTVKAARGSLLQKAKARPQQVQQVLDVIRNQGVVQAYRAVMKKLDSYSPLGYSCAGKVIGVGPNVQGIEEGDLVACGGLTACHAEVVSVPSNLCVNLCVDADLRQAAYNTLGAIALQGVRQVDLRLGETCAVIGLGLLGQLTALLLRASGVRVVGVDVEPSMVEIAAKHSTDFALLRETPGIEDRIFHFTGGLGCDAVIITAGTSSLDPINFAGTISRKKGTIVVVGAVPTGFDREPHFYKKELQVKMSCSYGPGRYDPVYEEKGIDYPAAYVRWTEKRNMEAFQELLFSGKIDVSYLTTHTFKLEDAPAAYDLLMSRAEPFVGILIEYDVNKPVANNKIVIGRAQGSRPKAQGISIGFIGAGSYAQNHLLPNIPSNGKVRLAGVMSVTGTGSRSVGERFGFEFCTSEEKDILENKEIDTVFIATRHDSHAEYVLKALRAGKNVFVEKPLCLREEELNEIRDFYHSLLSAPCSMPLLMVGYNRRFSPLAKIIKDEIGGGPMAMIYRVNAGAIPPESWIQDPETGGGRIIGEVCHFVDFLTFLNGSLPARVHATAMKDIRNLEDVLTVSLTYQNGSIGTIAYLANGDKRLPKERVEIFANGCTAVLEDFKTLSLYAGGKKRNKNFLSQNKGQKEEVRTFLDAVRAGNILISFKELCNTSLATFKILESLRTGQAISIQEEV